MFFEKQSATYEQKSLNLTNLFIRKVLERFSNDCRKTKTITPTNHNRSRHAMNLSQFQFQSAITCNSLEARERSRVHGAIGFGFASHWLKNWRESFKPITKRSNRNHGILSTVI